MSNQKSAYKKRMGKYTVIQLISKYKKEKTKYKREAISEIINSRSTNNVLWKVFNNLTS